MTRYRMVCPGCGLKYPLSDHWPVAMFRYWWHGPFSTFCGEGNLWRVRCSLQAGAKQMVFTDGER